MGYLQDKMEDALFEAKLAGMRDGKMPNEVYVDTVASLVRMIASEVANQTILEHEVFLNASGIDAADEQDDLEESIRLTVFKSLKGVVEDWKRCSGV